MIGDKYSVKKSSPLFFIINLILGLYLINIKFTFLPIPEQVTKLNEWIFLFGGLLIILGGINYLRIKR